MLKHLSFGVIIVVLTVAAAQAATTRYYSGTECEASEYSTDLPYLARYNSGCRNARSSVVAGCEGKITVVLPISANNSNTVDFTSVDVNVIDLNADYEISCYAVAGLSNGTYYQGNAIGSGLAFSGGAKDISISGTDLPNMGNSITGVYLQHVVCTIPSKWEIDVGSCVLTSNFNEILNYKVVIVGT